MLYQIKIFKPYSKNQLAFVNPKGQSWRSDDNKYYDRRYRSKHYVKSSINFGSITLKQIQQYMNSFKHNRR